ncbi:STP1 protein [Plasmodium ovale wallikeri]|uniref:STP1 protein n=1 Tax=Plasmodium ovale wallikeri TaxID=864142 RepID=A0A1A9AR26_PLAOA|nr:STP1 protein [Plasmodium ovale wallikeri]SBT58626.1 STP1 protein [Plasmodium ovale wallikeri]
MQKMVDSLGYTTHTRDVHIGVFLDILRGDIKKLIHTYGHKNCGLMHEELCEKISKIIYEKKTLVLSHTDERGKQKLNSEWRSQRNEFFNKLFKNEGFINVCYPLKEKGNQNLQKLKSKHIQFCKDKDERRSAVEAKPEYSVCKQYNMWIDTQRTSFTLEYLENVKKFKSQTVNKYFSTKEHPGGHDPRGTYHRSKLDCEIYNPNSKRYQKELVEKTPPISIYSPTSPTVKQESQGKGGSSKTDGDSTSIKTKAKENIPPKSKSHTPDSQIPSSSKTQRDGTSTVHDTPVKTENPGSPLNKEGEKKEATSIKSEPPTNDPPITRDEAPTQVGIPPPPLKDAIPTPPIQIVHAPTATTSLSSTLTTVKNKTSSQTPVTSPSLTITSDSSANPGSPLPSNPHPPAADAKGLDRAPQSSTSSDTLPTTHPNQSVLSTAPADSSLLQPQVPVLIVPPAVTTAEGPGTFISSSTSTTTTTVTTTTTTAAPASVTTSTISTKQESIPSTKQAPSESNSQEPPLLQVASEPKATEPNKVTPTPTLLSGSDTGGVSVPTQTATDDKGKQTSLSSETTSKPKDIRNEPVSKLSNIITQPSGQKPDKGVVVTEDKLHRTVDQNDPKHNTSPFQIKNNRDHNHLTPHVNADTGKIPGVRPGRDLNSNSFTKKGKNDNPKIIPESIPPLMDIIPTFLVILAILTLLYQLYKYTPFGFLLGRRRKRKKHDLKRIFEIPEKHTYESPNITVHEWEDPNLVGQIVEKDVYIKLLKMKRYEQAIHKKKKKKKTTLIEVHMEVLEEHKKDEWKLHKVDFLEICLRGFINEENDTYSKLSDSELTVNNTNKDKTVENIQKQDILWNNWIENHRNILEQWKEKEWFHILKNKWRNEQQKYKEKNYKLQENILNEQETHSIVSQKDIWKQWISKQTTFIDMFNKEDWFKSMVYVQDREKNNYHVNEYKNTSITSQIELKNEKTNYEHCRRKNIIQKLMVQIHMMVLEECIKEDIIKHKELCIDNFIEDIHNQNNYDEKRNIPQCDTDDFNVLEFEEIHTSKNK